jgi:CBS domain-containing protein
MPKAKEFMTTEIVSIDPDDSAERAISLMLQHHITGLLVVDAAGQVLGTVSDGDLLDLALDGDSGEREVFRYMTREVRAIDADDELDRVVEQFRLHPSRPLPVIHGDQLVGIIGHDEILEQLSRDATGVVVAY